MQVFYNSDIHNNFLMGEEARHCSKVLRLKKGDSIIVTDGLGTRISAFLTFVSNHQCQYQVVESEIIMKASKKITIAVCPTRKAERNEWMVEKMTEIGVQSIDFIFSENTLFNGSNRIVNLDRLNKISIAAMKQSLQYYVPSIAIHKSFEEYIDQKKTTNRFIAYVDKDSSTEHLFNLIKTNEDVLVLIGPEGDFSPEEINMSLNKGFVPVSLGKTRLRTETAAVAACHISNLSYNINTLKNRI